MPKKPIVDTKKAPPGKRKQATVYLPDDLLKRAKVFAIMTDSELSTTVEAALREYLDRHEKP